MRERIQAGVDAARAKGRVGGRPRNLTAEKVQQIRKLRKSGEFSVKQMCQIVGISRSIYYREFNNEHIS
ncbi:TPA: helix-turn-helix domain-containing protein [Legionella pneumophila]|nr:helix-turn-helix domain-containing protein [Legionella pneumophila]HEN4771459.1 helix-turn-helix domain-containing protein [Legionella pneumophila]